MEIIKHGATYRDKIEDYCDNCDCHFRYDYDDIKTKLNFYFLLLGIDRIDHYYTNCPDCGNEIWVCDNDYNMLKRVKESNNK